MHLYFLSLILFVKLGINIYIETFRGQVSIILIYFKGYFPFGHK